MTALHKPLFPISRSCSLIVILLTSLFCPLLLFSETALPLFAQAQNGPGAGEQPQQTFAQPTPAPQAPAKRPRPLTRLQRERQTTPETEPLPITNVSNIERPSLVSQGIALSIMSLLPFIIMLLSSFVKIVVVLSLLRNALGVQQAPPNQVLNGVAFLLSIYVMFPTAVKMYDAAQLVIYQKNTPQELLSTASAEYIIEIANAAKEPLRDFLRNNSQLKHQGDFYGTVYRLLPEDYRATLKPDDFMVLVPAFITSQLKSSFEIGVLIYIPFFVIDLVVSNILLAMGMMMLSPVTISMPLKLFLLVMLDGWTLLIEGLVSTFR